MTRKSSSYGPFLNPMLDTPEHASEFLDTQGSKFVSSVTKGGVALRRITYTFTEARDIRTINADIEGKNKMGAFDLKFEASYKRNDGSTSTDISIGVETKCAGGNPDLFQFTNDSIAAMQQLDEWKASVNTQAVVIAVGLQNVDKNYIPVLAWSEHELLAFRTNVEAARKAYWDFCKQKVAVASLIQGTEDAMAEAGMLEAERNETMIVIKAEERRLNCEYISRQMDHIMQVYFAQTAQQIKDSVYQPLPAGEFEVLLGELSGGRTKQCQIQVGTSQFQAKWYGPWCSAPYEGTNKPIGPYGQPQKIDFTRGGDGADDDAPLQKLFSIPAEGWDIKNFRVREGASSVLDIVDQSEDDPLHGYIPPVLRLSYTGRMAYNDGSVYGERSSNGSISGDWSNGLRQGLGKIVYADGSTYDGNWNQDAPHGFGAFVDRAGFVFEGMFNQGLKHGHGVLTPPSQGQNAGSHSEDLEGEWERDCFVTSGKFEEAMENVQKLPSEWQAKWIGRGIEYAQSKDPINEARHRTQFEQQHGTAQEKYDSTPGNHSQKVAARDGHEKYLQSLVDKALTVGVYTGMYRNDKRHGIGEMVFADGTTETGPWEDDEVSPAELERRALVDARIKLEGSKANGYPVAVVIDDEITAALGDHDLNKYLNDLKAGRTRSTHAHRADGGEEEGDGKQEEESAEGGSASSSCFPLKSNAIKAKITAASKTVTDAITELDALKAAKTLVTKSAAEKELVGAGIYDEIKAAEAGIENFLQSKPAADTLDRAALAKLPKSGEIEAKIRAGAPDQVNQAVKEREALRALSKAVGDSPAGRQLVADGIMDEIKEAQDAIEDYLQSKPMDPTALTALLKCDRLKTRLQPPGAVPHSVVQYKRDIVFNGGVDTFYPIVLPLPNNAKVQSLVVRRIFSEQAPDLWHPSQPTHKGGLHLHVEVMNRSWGGMPGVLDIVRHATSYTRTVGKVDLTKPGGYDIVVWLRGGGATGALYHFEASFPLDSQGDYATAATPAGSRFTPLLQETATHVDGGKYGQKYGPIGDRNFVPLADVSYRA
jgi:hypothetical protein